MALNAGIVGITNTGKTTIFNALTSTEQETTSYQFSTVEATSAVVNIPDNRIDDIFNNITSKKKVYSTIEIVDIAGLVKGAGQGEGIGNKFLADIKMVDAILHVVRCFDDENVLHVDGSVNPVRDIETVDTELIVKDLETIENRLEKNKKLIKAQNKDAIRMQPLYEKMLSCLENLEHPRTLNLSKDEIAMMHDMNLLTLKPVIYVCNISEDEVLSGEDSEYTKSVKAIAKEHNYGVVKICGKIEADISLMEGEEREEFLGEYGLKEPGLNLLLNAAYDLLGLRTFITEGEIEVKAWTIKKGMKAPQAAGVIHTDFEKKFIKADVISYEDFRECEYDRNLAKQNGKARLEGKDYVVNDGDVIIFKVGR
ncbi:MAG: redox-regulated ATPase YchF [Candidatus Cloacimonadota bacterium]|nr:MAG: redox-regulated ATPase YchF [Candidatus Cloacimonadota bacterium]PIE77837.1 MAG: redox-regulated ATPase YchF [Candidatus Delongbacteria bacterium]